MAHRAYQVHQDNPPTPNIFAQNNSITGIRSYATDNTNTVLITGSCPETPTSAKPQQAMLYSGPMPTASSVGNPMTPQFPRDGHLPYSSLFYGPNTPVFFNSPNSTYVRAVGSYNNYVKPPDDPILFNQGMLYQGPVDGSGSWIQIDMNVPNVINTIPHSTMGELVVGNYQVTGMGENDFNAFVCHVTQDGKPDWYEQLILISPQNGQPLQLVTAYGIWKNDDVNRPYTIAGGYKPNNKPGEVDVAYLVDYNPSSRGARLTPTPITYGTPPQPILHFEGITKYSSNCYSLAAMGQDGGAAFAIVKRDPANGSFIPKADWQPVQYSTSSGTPSGDTTANTVLTDNLYGIFKATNGTSIQSYVAPDLPPPVAFNCS